MAFRDDDRGQAIQIGAVILFGILVILFSTYQAFVVPQQNAQVEAAHQDVIGQQFQQLRNAIVSIPGGGAGESVALRLGTTYPARAIALNPPPPSGTIRTIGTDERAINVSIANATALDEETADFWDGATWTNGTGGVVYAPDYNEFENAPRLFYENTLAYEAFRSTNLTLAGQRVIDGDEITVVTLNGSLDRGSTGTVTTSVRAISTADRTVPITNTSGGNVTVRFASRYDAAQWRQLLAADGEFVNQSGHVVRGGVTEKAIPGSAFDRIAIELAAGENVSYDLRMAKVGVGTGTTGTDARYLTVPGSTTRTTGEGTTTRYVLEVRDRYNNPVSGAAVAAALNDTGTFDIVNEPDRGYYVTDESGRVSIAVRVEDLSGVPTESRLLNVSLGTGAVGAVGPDDPTSVQFNLTGVNTDQSGIDTGGGGAGPFALEWIEPTPNLTPSADDYTFRFNRSAGEDNQVAFTVTTQPTGIADLGVDFAVNNSSVDVIPTATATNGSGQASVTLEADYNQTVALWAIGGGGSDVVNVTVVNETSGNFTGGGGGPAGDQVQYVTGSGSAARAGPESRVDFDIENTGSSDVDITGIRIESPDGSLRTLREENDGSDRANQHEIYIDSSTSGIYEASGDISANDPGNNAYDLGTKVTLTKTGTLTAGETAQVTLSDFRNNGGNSVSAADKELTVTLYFGDGSSTTFSFIPPGY